MANWSDLKAAVASIVKTNGNKEITGQLLQNVLNNIISNVGLNSSFAGIATPETNPGTPDGNVFYLATTAGTYSNFNGIVINTGEAVILEWKGSWVKKDSGFATKEKLSELEENTNQKLSELGSKVGSIDRKIIRLYLADTYDGLNVGDYYTSDYEKIYYYASNNPLDVKKVLSATTINNKYVNEDSLFLVGLDKYTWNGSKLVKLSDNEEMQSLKGVVEGKSSVFSSGGFSFLSSSKAVNIATCISNYKLYTDDGTPYILLQTGWKESSPNTCLFYIEPLGGISNEGVVNFSKSVSGKPMGVEHVLLKNDTIVVEFDFDWDKYHELFPTDYYRGNQTYPLITYPIGKYNEFINANRIEKDKAMALGFNGGSAIMNDSNQKILQCISQYIITEKDEKGHKYILMQTGWKSSSPGSCLFYIKDLDANVTINATEYVTEKPTGVRKHCVQESNVQIQFVMDWDKYHELFPTDYYRGNQTNPLIVYPTSVRDFKIESEIKELDAELGDVISVGKGNSVLLVGASFASATNGWFELACSKLGINGVNRAVGGQRITDNVAARMMDASETMPHGSLFFVDGVDVFDKIDAFVMMLTHNDDVYLDEESYNANTLEYYKEKGALNLTPKEAFDFCIKQYKQWCAEYTISQYRTSGENAIHDILGNKECQILICSNWHKGRDTYNSSSRKLARRYNLPYCAFDLNLSIGEQLIEATVNTDLNQTPTKGLYHKSVLYAHYDSFYNGKWAGKTEVIGGVTYGWHPQTKSATFDYGTPKEEDGYYYPKIQRMLAGVFESCVSVV